MTAITHAIDATPPVPVHASHCFNHHVPQRKHKRFGPYILLQTLGEGEFGKVKLGQHIETGHEVAVKLIKKNDVGAGHRLNKVEREIAVLKTLKHPYIVKLFNVIETDKYIGIILEYASGGELFEYILANRYLKEKDSCKLFAQLISSVYYMHSKNIVHRDLKLENLLLDKHRNIVVSDFGFANQFTSDFNDLMATSCGSPCYAAPELIVNDGLYAGSAVDIWSCGVILYAMLCGYLPFDDDPSNPDGDNITLLYRYILSTRLVFPAYISSHAKDLMMKMLVPDPNKRCTLKDIMHHPWLEPYRYLFHRSIDDLEREAVSATTFTTSSMMTKRDPYAHGSLAPSLLPPPVKPLAPEVPVRSPNRARPATMYGTQAFHNLSFGASVAERARFERATKAQTSLFSKPLNKLDIPASNTPVPVRPRSHLFQWSNNKRQSHHGYESIAAAAVAADPAQDAKLDKDEPTNSEASPVPSTPMFTLDSSISSSQFTDSSISTSSRFRSKFGNTVRGRYPSTPIREMPNAAQPQRKSHLYGSIRDYIKQGSTISATADPSPITQRRKSVRGKSEKETKDSTVPEEPKQGVTLTDPCEAGATVARKSIDHQEEEPLDMGGQRSYGDASGKKFVSMGMAGGRKAMAAVRRSIHRKQRASVPGPMGGSATEPMVDIQSHVPKSNRFSWGPEKVTDKQPKTHTGKKVMEWLKRHSPAGLVSKEQKSTHGNSLTAQPLADQVLNKDVVGQVLTTLPRTGYGSIHHLSAVRRNLMTENTEPKLRIHHGAVDRAALTCRPPSQVLAEVIHTLRALGLEVRMDGHCKIRCVRRRAQIQRRVSEGGEAKRRDSLSALNRLSSSSGLQLRSLFFRSSRRSHETVDTTAGICQTLTNSSSSLNHSRDSSISLFPNPGQLTNSSSYASSMLKDDPLPLVPSTPTTPTIPSPHLTAADPATGTNTATTTATTTTTASASTTTATCPSISSNTSEFTISSSRNGPIYGDPTVDSGEEIRFAIEICRFRNLPGLYIVDIRRLRGNLWAYKFIYHKLLDLLDLDAKGGYIQTTASRYDTTL